MWFFSSATESCLFGRTLDTNSAMGTSTRSVTRQTKVAKDSLDIGISLYYTSPHPGDNPIYFLSSFHFILVYISSKKDSGRHGMGSFLSIESVSPLNSLTSFSVPVSHRLAYWASPSSILVKSKPYKRSELEELQLTLNLRKPPKKYTNNMSNTMRNYLFFVYSLILVL